MLIDRASKKRAKNAGDGEDRGDDRHILPEFLGWDGGSGYDTDHGVDS